MTIRVWTFDDGCLSPPRQCLRMLGWSLVYWPFAQLWHAMTNELDRALHKHKPPLLFSVLGTRHCAATGEGRCSFPSCRRHAALDSESPDSAVENRFTGCLCACLVPPPAAEEASSVHRIGSSRSSTWNSGAEPIGTRLMPAYRPKTDLLP